MRHLPLAMLAKASGWLDRLIAALCLLVSMLAIPLALLLFAQWPLREWLQAFSRQANDFAQLLFALYVAVAITAASRGHVHLASLAHDDKATRSSGWRRWALLACTAPWAVFTLWSGWPVVINSLVSLERFGETADPGYFLIKLFMMVLVILVLLDGIVQVMLPRSPQDAA